MGSDKSIKLKIVTQNKIVFEGDIKGYFTSATGGRIGILPDHAPITTTLEIGVTKVLTEAEPVYITTMGGIMHFNDNEAVILTDIAELGQDIDEVRAKEAMERAKAKLAAHKDKISTIKAQIALKKAIARISATRANF